MIRVYSDTKFYVYCIAGYASGGAELLHQLVSYLRDNGKQAFIILVGSKPHVLHPEYEKYNVELAEEIEDNNHNIEVLYEPHFYRATLNTKTQKVLWWLSVDNFYQCCDSFLAVKDIAKWSIKRAFRILLSRLYHKVIKHDGTYSTILSLNDIAKLDVVNAYQSEYAQNFLQNNGFTELMPLKDYINIEHSGSISLHNREDIVLYNPRKGMEFTKELIKLAPDIRWVPIINMKRSQVIDLMRRSKVYIDFGLHPGKDRLPRECAINGLCIITGRRGSANFYEDVCIDSKYKFNEKKCDKKIIINIIRDTLNNYETRLSDFALYRHRISLEKHEFEQQIEELFLNNLYG